LDVLTVIRNTWYCPEAVSSRDPDILNRDNIRERKCFARVEKELILAGGNLRSWLSDEGSRRDLVGIDKNKQGGHSYILACDLPDSFVNWVRMATYTSGQSVVDLKKMRDELSRRTADEMKVFFHPGAATLSAVFVDPRSPPRYHVFLLLDGELTINRRNVLSA